MVEEFGMDARYPLPSTSTKFFMGAYFFVIVAGWLVGLAPHRWFPTALGQPNVRFAPIADIPFGRPLRQV